MESFSGKILDGRYQIHEELGRGGMAYVYKAYDETDDKYVAIKILKEEFLGNTEFIRRFKNESKAIAVLSHPNIVKVYDVSFGDRLQYIVMEYIDGITLKSYISQQGAIPWKEAIHFTNQILRALQHAHEKGIIHRDIKPQNIMLQQDGTIKVTDFGIAQFSRSEARNTTANEKAIGSVHYISPEQARGGFTDEKADIYSVGVMLYEILTGMLPFRANNAVSVAIMQLQSEAARPRSINPDIPPGLEEITMRAMRKNPDERYRTAADMLRDIDVFRRNPSVHFEYKYRIEDKPARYIDAINSARPSPPLYTEPVPPAPEPAQEPERRSPAIPILTGIFAAFVVFVIVFAVLQVLGMLRTEDTVDVQLPDFVGKNQNEVLSDPENQANFDFEVILVNDDDFPEGYITAQKPHGNIPVKKKSKVQLWVNGTDNTQKVLIPPLEGKTLEAATSDLNSLNIKFTVIEVFHNETGIGRVVGTNPASGQMAVVGSTIELLISKGPTDTEVVVPNLSGMSYQEALQEIESKNLTVSSVKTEVDSTLPKDCVVSTSPEAGDRVAPGTPISLTVSTGKKPQKDIDFDITLPDINYDVLVKVYVDGVVSNSLTNTVNPAIKQRFNLHFTGTEGTKTVVIYIDDQKYKVITIDFDNGSYREDETISYDDPNDDVFVWPETSEDIFENEQ